MNSLNGLTGYTGGPICSALDRSLVSSIVCGLTLAQISGMTTPGPWARSQTAQIVFWVNSSNSALRGGSWMTSSSRAWIKLNLPLLRSRLSASSDVVPLLAGCRWIETRAWSGAPPAPVFLGRELSPFEWSYRVPRPSPSL